MLENNQKVYLVTGCAGFIGFHLSQRLINQGAKVVGIDNLEEDQSIAFKKNRISDLSRYSKELFEFHNIDISNKSALIEVFEKHLYCSIIHLAAKTGVRDSAINYDKYFTTNTIGTCNVIDCNKTQNAPLLFASSSSVYGNNKAIPFTEDQEISKPISLYAVSKTSTELIAHNYAINYNMPLIGLRFFTVYGPMGRPDMAAFLFIDAIYQGRTMKLFNKGVMERDFTYIDDIVEGIMELSLHYQKETNKIELIAKKQPEIFNIGFGDTRKVIDLVQIIEKNLNKEAKIDFLDAMKEDMLKTYSNTAKLKNIIGFSPKTNLEKGVKKTVEWYLHWRNTKN